LREEISNQELKLGSFPSFPRGGREMRENSIDKVKFGALELLSLILEWESGK
jgi:hypothetical protein